MNPILDKIQVNGVLHSVADKESREKIADIIKYKTMTKEQMLNVIDDEMPDSCSTFCSDDNNFYIYNKTNDANAETGKFVIYENFSIEKLADTPYVFTKPTGITLSLPIHDWLTKQYSLDDYCTNSIGSESPDIIFSNGVDTLKFKPMISMSYGDVLDVVNGKLTSNNRFITFTSSSSITTFGEVNEHNIRMILFKTSTTSSYTPDLSNPDNFKFCSHLPYLTDYTTDAAVQQEGYRLETTSTAIFVYLYIRADRTYCASKSDFGSQLSAWSSAKTPFAIGFRKSGASTSTLNNYTPPYSLYLSGNYTVTTDPAEIAEVTVSKTTTITTTNILYEIDRSVKSLDKQVSQLKNTAVSSSGGITADLSVIGKFIVGEDIIHRKSTIDASSNLGQQLFDYMAGNNVETTFNTLLTELKSAIDKVIQFTYPTMGSSFISQMGDKYYSNILKLEIPISYSHGYDQSIGKEIPFNTILYIDKIPSKQPIPNDNNDPAFSDVAVVHKFIAKWDDYISGDFNILKFNIVSSYDSANPQMGRIFTVEADGDIQTISRINTGGGNSRIVLDYPVPDVYIDSAREALMSDSTAISQLINSYFMSPVDPNQRFDINILAITKCTNFDELITILDEYTINFVTDDSSNGELIQMPITFKKFSDVKTELDDTMIPYMRTGEYVGVLYTPGMDYRIRIILRYTKERTGSNEEENEVRWEMIQSVVLQDT